jgi:LysR family transcriptional activator of nhaA
MEFLNYHHLYYFWTVCQTGGFSKAAQKLRLSQSAISEQVARLESYLDQKLIERTTRSFELTETGVMVLNYAETIFSTGDELMNFVRNRKSASKSMIRIGALGSLSRNLQVAFLSPILEKKDLLFSVTVGDSKRLLRLLMEHALDIVLSTFPAGEDYTGKLYTHLLLDSPLCLVASPHRNSINLNLKACLEHEPIFFPSTVLESRSDFDHYLESHRIRLNATGEIDDIALLRLLALSGKGAAVVPRIGVEQDLKAKTLVVLHEFRNIRQRFYAITRQRKFPNPLMNLLIRPLK